MLFENLSVDRLIIHEVSRRLDDKKAAQPAYGLQILKLGSDALEVFRERVVSAIGSQSQCMEMSISKSDPGSAIAIAHGLLGAAPGAFIQRSRAFADKLAEAQLSRAIPGGIVVVFTGTAGSPARHIVGVIKAETHTGFQRTSTLDIQYLKDLFLTPQTKLYKIGVFAYDGPASPTPPPTGWTATVYDSHMTSTQNHT